MLIDPIQMVGAAALLGRLRGCGYFSDEDDVIDAARSMVRGCWRAGASSGFRVVRTMYPPTSGHESAASRHAP